MTYLATYPIKSCYRVEADTAEAEPWGLTGDRRWLIVDEDAKLITQREWPPLGRIHPRHHAWGLLLQVKGSRRLSAAAGVRGLL